MKPALHSVIVACLITLGCAGAPDTDGPQQLPRTLSSHCLTVTTGSTSGIYRGIGSGKDLPEARRRAYADIAEQLSVLVHSDSEIQTLKQNRTVSTDWNERIHSLATATLDDLQLDCLDKSDPSGRVHLALLYDARPLHVRYGERIVELLGYQPHTLNLVGAVALTSSPFAEDLRKVVENPLGKEEFSSDIILEHTANGWNLYVAEQVIPLKDEQLPYAINWQTLNRHKLSLIPQLISGKRLPLQIPPATEYRWEVTANNTGYLHLIGFYQDGQLDILRQDLSIRRATPLIIPEQGGVLEAGLIAPDTLTTDSYIALVTDQPLSETPLGSLLERGRLGANGSLNRFFLTLENLHGAVGVVNLAVAPE